MFWGLKFKGKRPKYLQRCGLLMTENWFIDAINAIANISCHICVDSL